MKPTTVKNLHSTLGRNELPWKPLKRLPGDASLMGFKIPYPGLDKIVSIAKQWIENYRSEQFVRDKALQVTKGIMKNSRSGHPDYRNFDAIASAIHDFIVKEIVYVRDQNGVERLQTPDATLKFKSGDCDDMVILGGSLLESLGVPTRLKLIGSKAGSFSHIYLEYESNGQWKSFDPTLAMYPGYEFPRGSIKAEKTVSINRPAESIAPSETERSSLSGYINPTLNTKKSGKAMSNSGYVDPTPNTDELGFIDPVTAGRAAQNVYSLGKKILGGKKDPNYSNNSLVDTLANFEKISNARAGMLADEIIKAKVNGASNMDIAKKVADAGGYTVGQVTSSKKWPLVLGQLSTAVSAHRAAMPTVNASGSPVLKKAPGEAGKRMMIYATTGLAAITGAAFLLTRNRSKN